MSHEGITLISRVLLVALLIVVTAVVRVLVGPNKRRHVYMGMGTVGGVAAGVSVSSFMPHWIAPDVLGLFAILGIFAGWGVAWVYARRIPREAK